MKSNDGTVTLSLLGVPRLSSEGQATTKFRSRRALALLAYLIAQNRPIPRSELVELIWPDKTEKQGRANLRWALSYLGQLLPDALDKTRRTVAFALPDSCEIDVVTLTEAMTTGDLDKLGQLLSLVHGDYMQGFYFSESADFETWLITQRETWRLRIFDALGEVIAHQNVQGNYEEGLKFAQQWLEIEPWAETAHRWAMELLGKLGKVGAAIEQYERCWRVLAEELGTEPMVETTALYQRLQQSTIAPKHNLPPQPTEFVGRDDDLANLQALLLDQEVRLTTITGPGGMGKTRLAVQGAQEVAGHFLDGVAFVSLVSVDSAENIPTAIVNTLFQLGIIPNNQGGPPTAFLQQQLHNKELLLVLDNFEHVMDGLAIILQLLKSAPRLKFLITSRERLNIRWEHLLPIGGLPSDEALALFEKAAARSRPGFTQTQANLPYMMHICHLVDGMPLAIELAASWVRLQTIQSISVAIKNNLDLLTTSQRDMPDRHQSVRAAYDYSWQLLSDQERTTLSKFSVFSGGFTAHAAQAIAGASWSSLAPLVDKSLIRQELVVEKSGSEVRYSMHPLLKQFSAEKLSAEVAAETIHKHSTYYTQLLQTHNAGVQRGDKAALDVIQGEIENIRLMWQNALKEPSVSTIASAFQPLAYFYDMRCRWQEGNRAFKDAVNILRDATSSKPDQHENQFVLGGVLISQANFQTRLGKSKRAERLLNESIEIMAQLNRLDGVSFCNFALGRIYNSQGDYEKAEAVYQRSIEVSRQIDHEAGIARGMVNLSGQYVRRGMLEKALEYALASEELFVEGKDLRGVGVAQLNRANIAFATGAYEQAKNHLEKVRSASEEVGTQTLLAVYHQNIGELHRIEGEYDLAKENFERAIDLFEGIGEYNSILFVYVDQVILLVKQNKLAHAHMIARQARELARSLHDVYGNALSQNALGMVLTQQGLFPQAEQHFQEAFNQLVKNGSMPQALKTVANYVGLLVETGRMADAHEFAAVVRHHPATLNHIKVDLPAELGNEVSAPLSIDELVAKIAQMQPSLR